MVLGSLDPNSIALFPVESLRDPGFPSARERGNFRTPEFPDPENE